MIVATKRLKAENFEGFDFTKALNQKFSLSYIRYDNDELFLQLMLIGRVVSDGRLKANIIDKLVLKVNAQLTNEQHMPHAMFNFDYMGQEYRAQLQLGNIALIGVTYIHVK
ncbi:unnamed protein product [Thlaspi arvense]|uniref:Uncharacterized protein n=1 Tax=Thlaspi arvense TaxID=13288 RepID=A0AAU9SHF1_THLAR|nr:unnamed protein product [Thlaspi arvense]